MLRPDPAALPIGAHCLNWQALASAGAPNLPADFRATAFDAAMEAMRELGRIEKREGRSEKLEMRGNAVQLL